ncbi:platelet glycoprotein Ib alpha chain [Macrotis lagotis]|uniref:platelet glycoprotein Ib alpha chain n=1 Tax=Macrotis lagotis TaxID=92651 RepID=UPI003D6865A6
MNLRISWEMDLQLLLILLFLLLLGPSHSQFPCDSQKVASKVETNCELRGLKSVPTKLSPDTAILQLQNNDLKSFSTSSLSLLTQLTELYLTKNNISVLVADGKLPLLSILDISDNAIKTWVPLGHSLPSLTFLDLSRNALEFLPPGALTGLGSLENLYLAGNKLTSLPPNFLKEVPHLQKLDLANNYLQHLSADLLVNLHQLNTLFLQNNLLSVLPYGFFLDHLLPYVFLHSNPWKCNCELRYLQNWLKENQGSVYFWKKGVDVKVMTPDVKSVQCDTPFRTPVYTFSMNCPITGDRDYDSYDEYDGLTEQGVLESETTVPTTNSLKHSTIHNSSNMTMIEPTTFPITSETITSSTTGIILNSPETTMPSTMISSEATTPQTTLQKILPLLTSQGLTMLFKSPETTVFPTMPELTRFLFSSEASTTSDLLRSYHIPEKVTFPTSRSSTLFLNIPETTVFPTMPELTRLLISEAITLQTTSESIAFSENQETTRFPNSPEATTFPVTSKTIMLQTISESVTFPTTDSTVHTSFMLVTSPRLSSTLTLLNSNIPSPNEVVALGSLSDPSNSSQISISCCLFSLWFYIFGIAWALISSIVLIVFLALVQPPHHLLRTYTFMEDSPNPQGTVHLELHKRKEVIVHRAWLLFLGGTIPSFRTRLFLWVRSNGQVGPLTLKRKPSALSLGQGEDLLGSVSIKYSGHSL